MPGIAALLFLCIIEITYCIYGIVTKKATKELKNKINCGEMILVLILMLTHVMPFGIRWSGLILILSIRGVIAVISMIRFKLHKWTEKENKNVRLIRNCILSSILVLFACVPALLFLDYKSVEMNGAYTVATNSYTWTDTDRIETYSQLGENRKVTVQFWYPQNASENEKFPLIIFSHGAYGFRGSNQSLCEGLAANGYVVCSIDHTYQSIFTEEEDGTVVTVSPVFLNEFSLANSDKIDEEENLRITDGWLAIRTGDFNFVLDTIIDKSNTPQKDADNQAIYSHVDTTKILLTGHSLGGTTAAEVGRNRDDITAVIDIDGTMSGEIISAKGNEVELDQTPYPIPLLNIYGQYHYDVSRQIADQYMNTLATKNGVDGMETVILGAQHLNYTDLPLFAPGLAKLMGVQGTGNVDARACIQKLDEIILNYCNHYLKNSESLSIEKEISLP